MHVLVVLCKQTVGFREDSTWFDLNLTNHWLKTWSPWRACWLEWSAMDRTSKAITRAVRSFRKFHTWLVFYKDYPLVVQVRTWPVRQKRGCWAQTISSMEALGHHRLHEQLGWVTGRFKSVDGGTPCGCSRLVFIATKKVEVKCAEFGGSLGSVGITVTAQYWTIVYRSASWTESHCSGSWSKAWCWCHRGPWCITCTWSAERQVLSWLICQYCVWLGWASWKSADLKGISSFFVGSWALARHPWQLPETQLRSPRWSLFLDLCPFF